jgi:hypothetical protein
MLHHSPPLSIPATLFVFDVLAVEGLPVTSQPYSERRALLEQLVDENRHVRLVATFEDGQALFDAVCERGLWVWCRRASAIRAGRANAAGEDEEPRDSSFRGGTRRCQASAGSERPRSVTGRWAGRRWRTLASIPARPARAAPRARRRRVA